MSKNSVLRTIVERTNKIVVTMSQELEEVLSSVIDLAGLDETQDLAELIWGAEEMMLELVESDQMDQEAYLTLCAECMMIALDGNVDQLIA